MRFLLLIALFCNLTFASMKFPALTDRVVDNANLLDAQTKTSLIELLKTHENNSTDQIVVATINSLDGNNIDQYANELFRHWKLGQKDKNNGVLLLVSLKDRKVRIEVGYGLEGALTDKISHDIIQNSIIPNFKKDNYTKGILKGAKDIIRATKGEYILKVHSKKSSYKVVLIPFVTILGFIIIIIGSLAKSEILHRVGVSAYLSVFGFAIADSAFDFGSMSFIVMLVMFFALLFLFRNIKLLDNNKNSHTTYIGSGGFGSGFGSGFSGGFSGGGGSSGGGGASGGW